ncbi:hypothetical protein L6R49_27155 [Myxococcota bacterium]|nr:hypothetical protein [Myxococcota bacterium]
MLAPLLLMLTPTAQAACPSRLTAEALEARLLAAQDPVVYAEPAAEATLEELEASLRDGCVDGPVPKTSLGALFLAHAAYETLRPDGDPVAASLAYARAAALGATPEPAYGADVRDALAKTSVPQTPGTLDLWPEGATAPIYLDGEAIPAFGERQATAGLHFVQWTTQDGAWSGALVELRPGETVVVGARPAPTVIVRELPPEPAPEPSPEPTPLASVEPTPLPTTTPAEPAAPLPTTTPAEPAVTTPPSTTPAAPAASPIGLSVTLGAELARYAGQLDASPAAFSYVHPRGGLIGALRYGQRGFVELTSHLAPASPVTLPDELAVQGAARLGGPHQLGLGGGVSLGEAWGGELGVGALAVWTPTVALTLGDDLRHDVALSTTRALGPELRGALVARGPLTVKLQGRAAWLFAADIGPRLFTEGGVSVTLPVSAVFAPAMSVDVGRVGPNNDAPDARLSWTRAWGGVQCSF